jgi:hypothetical protein
MPKYKLNEFVMITNEQSIPNAWRGKLCQVVAIDESVAYAEHPYKLRLQGVDCFGRMNGESWFRIDYIAKIDEKEYKVDL